MPMPPNKVTINACADDNMPNTEAGVTISNTTPYKPPAKAVNAPEMAMAANFQGTGLMPEAIAAASFCLMASRAIPKRDLARAKLISNADISITMATTMYKR